MNLTLWLAWVSIVAIFLMVLLALVNHYDRKGPHA